MLLFFCILLFQQVTTDMGPPKVEIQFFEGLAREPGDVEVVYKKGTTQEQRRQFEKAVGLVGPRHYTVEYQDGSEGVVYEVGVGYERFWLKALEKHPLVRNMDWPIYKEASIAKHVFVDLKKDFPRASQYVKGSAEAISDCLEGFLRARYAARGATIRALGRGPNYLHLLIDHLRSEVNRTSNDWEQIEIYSVFFDVENGVELHVIVDARYAESLSREPAPAAFTDMATDHFKVVSDYVQELTTAMAEALHQTTSAP